MHDSPKHHHLVGEDDTSPRLQNTTNGVHPRTPGDCQPPTEILRARCCICPPDMGKEEGQPNSNANGDRELMGFHFIPEKYPVHVKCHLLCFISLKMLPSLNLPPCRSECPSHCPPYISFPENFKSLSLFIFPYMLSFLLITIYRQPLNLLPPPSSSPRLKFEFCLFLFTFNFSPYCAKEHVYL